MNNQTNERDQGFGCVEFSDDDQLPMGLDWKHDDPVTGWDYPPLGDTTRSLILHE